jgi:D-proline reductase (dithiol) PrdB
VTELSRLKNRFLAKILTRFPLLAKYSIASYDPAESTTVPWTPLKKPLNDCSVALVTTAGVHQRDQRPFDMTDPNGDPSFRAIETTKPLSDLTITHDYYDHGDADRDMNIVFPLERLREFETLGIVRAVADIHYGFMGHILGPHLRTLVTDTAPDVARLLKAGNVDVVLLTPG